MGSGRWEPDEFVTRSVPRASAPRATTFTAKVIDPVMDPVNIVVRESRDSVDNPESTAIIVAFDETGSMGDIPAYFALGQDKRGHAVGEPALGVLMRELLLKKPVPGPQLLVCGVGDSVSDRSPLQPGQFESDIRSDDWLTKIHLEGGGGGGGHESYGLVHHFAGTRTSIDCFEKRGDKGFLFTIGDEMPHPIMYKREIEKVFGAAEAADITVEAAIKSAQRMYEVFHIVVKSESYPPSFSKPVWDRLLPERVLVLDDPHALAELITTTIALVRGMSVKTATAGFSAKTTEMVLRSGVTNLARAGGGAGDIVTL